MAKYIDYETFKSLDEKRRKQVFDIMLELNLSKDLLIEALKAKVDNIEERVELLSIILKAYHPGLNIFEEEK